MSTEFTHCKISRSSDRSEIKSILEQNSLKFPQSSSMAIGSRAARHWLPNFRGLPEDKNADRDVITSSKVLLDWLHKNEQEIHELDMIVPLSNDDDEQLDLYIYCTLHDGSIYDFTVPRSSTSYTAYILSDPRKWGVSERVLFEKYPPASSKLLLILKKYMLYYSHQWEKTAKDYYELLAVAPPLTASDMELCDLFMKYNEKVHGPRPLDFDEFVMNSTSTEKGVTIHRDEFFHDPNDKQLSLVYQVAMSLSFTRDLLIGLKHICTQGPLWLANYVIENWVAIHQEKFKEKIQVINPPIQIELDNYRLFPEIPEIATRRILHCITDTADFCSMQLVCKRWHAVLQEEIFWRDLYTARYGAGSSEGNHVYSWKILYLVRMEGKFPTHNDKLNQLVDATVQLRQYTANDVLKLWEDLTYRNQSVEPDLLLKINYVLSNSFYYQIEKTSEEYIVQLILIGLEYEWSRSKVDLKLRVGEYGSSRYTDHMEHLSVEYQCSNISQRSLDFFGPALFGYNLHKWGYKPAGSSYLGCHASTIADQYPSGLLICLLIMMVHPDHRAHFIEYLKDRKRHCSKSNPW